MLRKIFQKNATFELFLMSNDEPKFFLHFNILHIKSVWFLLKLEMALVNSIEMWFALVCFQLIRYEHIFWYNYFLRTLIFEPLYYFLRACLIFDELSVNGFTEWIWFPLSTLIFVQRSCFTQTSCFVKSICSLTDVRLFHFQL